MNWRFPIIQNLTSAHTATSPSNHRPLPSPGRAPASHTLVNPKPSTGSLYQIEPFTYRTRYAGPSPRSFSALAFELSSKTLLLYSGLKVSVPFNKLSSNCFADLIALHSFAIACRTSSRAAQSGSKCCSGGRRVCRRFTLLIKV